MQRLVHESEHPRYPVWRLRINGNLHPATVHSMPLYVHRNWTAASYCSSVFQLQNLIPFIKKSNCTKYRHRTACCYCTLCSNVILTAAVYCHQLVSEHNVKWHLSPSSLTVSFVHCIIVTFWMAMLTVFGGHFVVRHYTEDTCIGVCCGL